MSRQKNIHDIIIAREGNLMYEKGRGFEPYQGDMTRWRGLIPGRGNFSNRFFTVEIEILDGYPATVPLVKMISEVDHPRVNQGGIIDLWIVKRWTPDYHLFQVANSLKGLFAREPLQPARHLLEKDSSAKAKIVTDAAAVDVFTRQKEQLEETLRQKELDIARIKAALAGRSQINRSSEREKYLENRKLQLNEELFAIEEQFHWADMTVTDFAKEYLHIRTQLQLIVLQS